jgi:hypothetical protein
MVTGLEAFPSTEEPGSSFEYRSTVWLIHYWERGRERERDDFLKVAMIIDVWKSCNQGF